MGKVIHRRHRCDLSSFQLRLRRPEHFLNEDFSIPVAFHIVIEKAKKRPGVKKEFTRSSPLHLKPKDGQRPSLTRLSAESKNGFVHRPGEETRTHSPITDHKEVVKQMTGNAQAWRESMVHVARTDLTLIKGGTGRPLLVLHEELGHPGWLRWHAALAQSHTLYIPRHPGFGTSPR